MTSEPVYISRLAEIQERYDATQVHSPEGFSKRERRERKKTLGRRGGGGGEGLTSVCVRARASIGYTTTKRRLGFLSSGQ